MIETELDELDTFDAEYRDWLIARRLENQTASLRLHSLIRRHAIRIGDSESLVETTKGLVRAASSLWRAAWLSDRNAVYDDVEDEDFVLTDRIIENEFVPEPTVRGAPDWSFFVHMSNARGALTAIAADPELTLLSSADIPAWIGLSYKECWVRHQSLLDRAVERFERILDQQPAAAAISGHP